MSTVIQKITAHQILDSRGNPTIEANVFLSDGSTGTASVPSGASTGQKEAIELRDTHNPKWCYKGVFLAIENIEKIISPALCNKSPFNLEKIDQTMKDLDGTKNKSKLGANAILAVSLATLKSAAISQKSSLFNYISKIYLEKEKNKKDLEKYLMPTPMMNILNGGSHADNNVDIQEFMIMPINFSSYSDALRCGTEVFHKLKKTLKNKGYSTAIGDEGGFAPNLKSNKEALDLIMIAIKKAGYKPGKDVFLALDVAASEFYNSSLNQYFLDSENKKLTSKELIDYYHNLCCQYPIISIEDGIDQNDWRGWQDLNAALGEKIQIVGDDLTVTNPQLLKKAIECSAMNAILIKLNQIGTFTETMDAIMLAKRNNFKTIISHRSGETEDTVIADLAVGVAAGQIKTGSLCRTDRTAKYNQLLRIEKELKNKVLYSKIID